MWFVKKQHSATTKSLVCAAFPDCLRDDVLLALPFEGIAPHEPHIDPRYQSRVEGSVIALPYRVYFPPARMDDINALNRQQQAIFAAIMTRHHDGHQREYWTRILCSHPAAWAAPYIAGLLGDYVIQVLAAVRESLTPEWLPIMIRYAAENQICLRSLNHRIINYWTLYYRYSPPNIRKLTEYPGYTVAQQLGLWDRRTAPKLLRKARANKETEGDR